MSESPLDAAPVRAASRRLMRSAPVVSPASALLSRAIGRGVRLDLPGVGIEWLLLPGGRSQRLRDSAQWLVLETAAGPLWLEDGARLLAGLTGIESDPGSDLPGPDWPPWLTGALAGRLQGTLLASLAAVRPSSVPDEGAGTALELRLRDGRHALCATAVATAEVWLALLDEAGANRRALSMPWSNWLPLAVSRPVLLAVHGLPAALFDDLAAGDLILPSTPYFDTTGHGRLRLAARRWRVRYAGPGRLHILNEESDLSSEHMDDDEAFDAALDDPAESGEPDQRARVVDEDDPGAADERPEVPGSLDLRLRFELGRLTVSLDQLRALGPGVVLELADGSAHEIAIVCSGARVGDGEVVDVEGRLGVRITHWGGAC
ncbi:MAG: hypothetical protein ABS43_12280 [Bordetella sp. SCN 67-23]|nr:FliM/FliN family flagellar motor switch protein [Burkholderiales bacterium]ODS73807.1 MAG: hypothetical protein ABS43_12280 [Bordetella sp. SCN 67-23]OJW92738.1 MAG: hypothetical protein BGO71_23525 [Burkholderiales bacterium 67-32]